jgi:hypothetical protein
MDRIPKSDIVREIATIGDVHSVDVSMMSRKNEEYHKKQKLFDENRRNDFASKEATKLDRPNPSYNPKLSLGIDPILGDIVFEPSEVPIIRGGWYDRNDIYYSDDINDKSLKSVNIFKKGTVDSSKRQRI